MKCERRSFLSFTLHSLARSYIRERLCKGSNEGWTAWHGMDATLGKGPAMLSHPSYTVAPFHSTLTHAFLPLLTLHGL